MEQSNKLDLAAELITTKIADLYQARNKAITQDEVNYINSELFIAFQQKELILMGDIVTIEEVLKERGIK